MPSFSDRFKVLTIAALIAVSSAACGQDEEILRPEAAFPYTLEATAVSYTHLTLPTTPYV